MSSTVSNATSTVGNAVTGGVSGITSSLLNPLLDPQAAQRAADQARQQGNINSANASLDQLLASMRGTQGTDQSNAILNANTANTAERTGTLNQQDAARQQQLKSLASLLADQNQIQMKQASPGILEDLNSRGLLRSSAVGNQYALAQKQLQETTNNQLAQQALKNQEAYTSGLGGITEADIAGKGSALQRQLSLSDFANQVQAGKLTGQATAPIQPFQGKVPSPLLGVAGGIAAGMAGRK